MSQKSTEKAPPRSLDPTQLAVIELLLSGKTVSASAEAAGVCRETVHRWKREDWLFQAEINQRLGEVQYAIRNRLISTALAATETVNQAISGGDVKAALTVLKGLGVLAGSVPPIGPDNPDDLKQEDEYSQAERKNARLYRSIASSF
jgi:hypothetical protein